MQLPTVSPPRQGQMQSTVFAWTPNRDHGEARSVIVQSPSFPCSHTSLQACLLHHDSNLLSSSDDLSKQLPFTPLHTQSREATLLAVLLSLLGLWAGLGQDDDYDEYKYRQECAMQMYIALNTAETVPCTILRAIGQLEAGKASYRYNGFLPFDHYRPEHIRA